MLTVRDNSRELSLLISIVSKHDKKHSTFQLSLLRAGLARSIPSARAWYIKHTQALSIFRMTPIYCLLAVLPLIHAAPSARVSAIPMMVYNWTRDHCPSYPAMPPMSCLPDIKPNCDPDVADACTRAWVTTNGSYRMLGSVNGVSRAEVGSAFNDLAHSCAPPYANATYDGNLSNFRDNAWIEAPVVVSNSTVYALTHVDSMDASGQYLYTSITLFSSVDGGESFAPARAPPAHLVATTPYDNTNLSLGVPGVGFGMPSSVFKDPSSAFYFTIVLSSWGRDVRAQQGGLCLLRTADVTDPASWRAWNGSHFSVALNVSPLLGPVPDPDSHTCVPLTDESGELLGLRHLSLLWSTFFNSYLLFGESSGASGVAGWSFTLSSDLLSWGVPTQVDPAGFIDPAGNGTAAPRLPLPGRFIKAAGSHTHWEEPGGKWKAPVGSCVPCPELDACTLATTLTLAEFNAIPTATFDFSCSFAYDTTGYESYVYSVLVDDTKHHETGNDASFNVVGQDAHLFLVAKKCAGVLWDHNESHSPSCTPLDGFGRDERDIVRTAIHFAL